MRIAEQVVRLEADQKQSHPPRADGAPQPKAVESSEAQPGLQVQISEDARGAMATGETEGQDEGAAAVNAYRQGARRAPPVQDWALDWGFMSQVEAEAEPSEGVSSGRNVGAIYLQNAAAGPKDLGVPHQADEPARSEPEGADPVLAEAVAQVDVVA